MKKEDQTQQKNYQNGKIIVMIAAVSNILFSLAHSMITSFDIGSLIIQFLLSASLFSGIKWLRWLLIIRELSSSLVMLLAPFTLGATFPLGLNISLFILGIILAMSGLLLIFNQDVNAFLSSQRTQC
ncbi:MAG: hypothetical protein RR915_02905 [Cellulosilyticaceae bacterium]